MKKDRSGRQPYIGNWIAFLPKSILSSGLIIVLLILGIFSAHAQLPNDFQRVDLLTNLTNATTFKFAPDGRVFIVDRYGELLIYDPASQTSFSAGTIEVFHELEDGLLGLAFDPNFLTNNYIYLHYSPLATSVNRVSRFTLNGNSLVMNSEVVVLQWPTQRISCCHSGGDMDFDSQGNLYIATGDNTDHSNYATLNENDINKSSENTSSDTKDLRGKILRITPLADGSYTIPPGNLFNDPLVGRPEVYVMGARNPYRIFIDRENSDWLFWGEVGPDANTPSSFNEPEGLDEINLTKTAGNYGWPYFSGQNRPYRIHYAQTPYFNDPAAPKNISKWNTGAENLPPAQPSLLQFLHKCYLAGPRYYHDPGINDPKRLPVEFNNKFFYYDFNSSWIWVATLDSQGNVQGTPERLAPSVFPTAATGFIDMKIGPDGHLYILEYGTGCCPGNTGTGKLVRVDYTGIVSNSSPIASISATPNNGDVPLTVQFSAAGSSDPDGDSLTYEWDFENDGTVDATGVTTSHTYTNVQNYTALLRVNDGNGGVVTKTTMIYAGNTISEFTFNSPPDGGLINWNDDINFNVSVNDAEDGSTQNGGIDCNDVNLVPSIGHLNHFHDDLGLTGCPQLINLDPGDHDIHGEMDIFYVLGVNYRDNGGLTSFDQIQLHPKRKEAEFYSTSNNVVKIGNSDLGGGGNEAIRVNNNSNISLAGRNLQNISSVKYRVASQVSGGTIELRVGSASGSLVSSAAIPNTDGTNNWTDVVANFTAPSGKNDLYFVFKNSSVQQNIFDLNYIEFLGAGVSIDNSPPEITEVEVVSTTQLKVNFSEYVSQSTAENVNNYILNNGASVQTAVLQTDLRSVLLNTTLLNSSSAYQLDISNVENLAGIPMLPASFDLNIFQPIRINPGGPQIIIDGNTFSPDQYSTGGSTYSNSVAISNTSDDVLYQTERYGSNFSYNIPVPQNGAYDFKLHFAEIYFGVGNNPGGAGSRVFNVSIEGNQLISNLDIYAEAGPATALIKEFSDIAVNDGVATIQFNSVIENAKISGIEVLARGSASDNEPSITISSPQEGATVNSPVQVSFSLSNWNLAPGGNHIKYYVDGNLSGSHYNTDPILIGQLTPGAHNIKLELFYPDQSSSGVSDQVNVVVNDPAGCNSGIFPNQWQPHIIGPAHAYRSVYILPQFDLDNDGLKDIVSGGWWYKNPGSIAGNWTKNTIGTNFNNVAYVHDFDNDGDPDLLGTKGAYESSALIWAQNDGNGNFTVYDNLPVGATTYSEPFLAGIAGGIYQQGGAFQLALNWNGAETGTSQVQMLTVPTDPVNGTWTLVNIHPTSLGEALSNGDIDGDGDLDLFQGSNWLRNDGGTWTLFSTGITFPTTMDRNMLADFDQDGDLDAVVTQIGSNREIAWFEAPADPTQTWIKHTIDPDIDGGLSLDVKDIDFDGDLDIVVGEWRGAYQLIGFANDLCNNGGWIKKTINSGGGNLDHHDGAQIVDLDKDGDYDIVSIGWNNITPRIFENQSNIQASDPLANAGPDRAITLPANSLTLNGAGSDPDGGNVSFAWTEISHPGTPATLTDANTANLTASGLVEGTYVFRLTVTDDESATAFDEVSVTVNPEPSPGLDEHWLEAECATVGSNWSVITDAQAS
ncbi:PQQ-dependent sugar dehydrogenase, partial [Zeaxanthinibacter sp. PT1]|uniref:PQQ-dependent sugar dehydrogenase n=1 Tax=Zeaxanthinibacter TaxID=561554 RepID=UPI00234B76F6